MTLLWLVCISLIFSIASLAISAITLYVVVKDTDKTVKDAVEPYLEEKVPMSDFKDDYESAWEGDPKDKRIETIGR